MKKYLFSASAMISATAKTKKAWRLPMLLLGLAIFLGGTAWSIRKLGIDAATVETTPLLILVLLLAPASLVYGGVNMWLTAKATKVDLDIRKSTKIAAFAQSAEILPLPGGAIVRTAALMREGAATGRSASQVLASGILWIACAAAAGGISVSALGSPAYLLASAGLAGIVVAMAWIWFTAGAKIALFSLMLRAIGIPLAAARLYFSFSALGLAVSMRDTFLFSFASIAGSASSLAPAGLGISEGFAALLATLVSIAPAAAFLAVGLDRFIGFTASAIASLVYLVTGSRRNHDRPTLTTASGDGT